MPSNRMLRTWMRATDFASSFSAGITLFDMLSDYKTEKGVNDVRGTVSAYYGEVTVVPEAIVAAGVVIRVAFGIGVFDQGTSAATVPDPLADSYPWMWKWEGHISPQALESSSGVFTFVPRYIPIQMRSQRVLRFNDDLFMVFSHGAGADVTMTSAGNVLFKG